MALGVAAAVVIGAIIVWTALAVARRAWHDRWRRPVAPAVGGEPVDHQALAPGHVFAEAAPALRAALDNRQGRNAVVQCWLDLERALAHHGLVRDAAATPAEFTRAVLLAVSSDVLACGELTDLFVEARFSDHEIDEFRRARARHCLDRVLSTLDIGSAQFTDVAGPVGR